MKKGVLVDPYELGIQPAIVNDAWVVKKQGSAHLKWEECQEKDVRMVTGFDPVNKFLSQILNLLALYSSFFSSPFFAKFYSKTKQSFFLKD